MNLTITPSNSDPITFNTRPENQPDECPTPGVYPDIGHDTYHRIDAASASVLKKFNQSGMHGAMALDERTEPTRNMLLGTALHTRVLEPERYERDAILTDLADNCVYHKHAKAQRENPGKIILHKGWPDLIERLAQRIIEHPKARPLLQHQGTKREVGLIWEEQTTLDDGTVVSVPCKALLDMMNPALGIIPDLKFTNEQNQNPHKWKNHFYDMGYHRSFGWYLRGMLRTGVLDAMPEKMSEYVAMVITGVTSPPYMVQVYGVPRAYCDRGFTDLWVRALPRYIRYRTAGEESPPEYHGLVSDEDGNPQTRTGHDILPCHMPGWAVRDDEPVVEIGGTQ